MRSLSIIGVSMLIPFIGVRTQSPTLPFNLSPSLICPSYAIMFHVVHLAATCTLGYLLLMTYHELKQIKNNIAQEKRSKLTKEKHYVTHSYLEHEINDGIEQKMDTTAKQAGRFFTTAGEGSAIKEQLQDQAKTLSEMERRIQAIEQKIVLKSEKNT